MSEPMTARDYAMLMHGGQKYGGDKPYVYHLDAVDAVLVEFGYNHKAYSDAAYLHDVLEDCCPTGDDLLRAKDFILTHYGTAVLGSVIFCTDSKLGANRKERKENTYNSWALIIGNGNANPWVTMAMRVKLADRLANVRQCKAENSKLLGMYRKEAYDFRCALYTTGISDAMWAEYDRLLPTKE